MPFAASRALALAAVTTYAAAALEAFKAGDAAECDRLSALAADAERIADRLQRA